MNLFENLQVMKESSKPIASLPITADVSLNIFKINYNKILVGYDEDSAEWVDINYTNGDAHPYFEFNGERYSTDFFMKNENYLKEEDVTKYKLRIYKFKGSDKGNLDHEEFFNTKSEMESRYKEIVQMVSEKLPEYKRQAYFPTVWEETENGWERIEGY